MPSRCLRSFREILLFTPYRFSVCIALFGGFPGEVVDDILQVGEELPSRVLEDKHRHDFRDLSGNQ